MAASAQSAILSILIKHAVISSSVYNDLLVTQPTYSTCRSHTVFTTSWLFILIFYCLLYANILFSCLKLTLRSNLKEQVQLNLLTVIFSCLFSIFLNTVELLTLYFYQFVLDPQFFIQFSLTDIYSCSTSTDLTLSLHTTI